MPDSTNANSFLGSRLREGAFIGVAAVCLYLLMALLTAAIVVPLPGQSAAKELLARMSTAEKAGQLLIDRDAETAGAPVTRTSYRYTGRGDLSLLAQRDRVGFAARRSDFGFEVSGIWKLRSAAPRGADGEGALLIGQSVSQGDGRVEAAVAIPAHVQPGRYQVFAGTPGNDTYQPAVSD